MSAWRAQEETAEPEYGWGDAIVTGGLRVVPSILGTLGGAAAGVWAGGVGAVPGGMAGGAAGGGLGEWLAQQYEKARGLRDETSLGAIGIEAGLGAIPFGKSATLGRAAIKGAATNVVGGGLHRRVERGDWGSVDEAVFDAALGGVFGGGSEAAGRWLTRGRPHTFNELSEAEIAKRHANVERAPGDEIIEAADEPLLDELGYPRPGARDPRLVNPNTPLAEIDAEPISPFGPNTYDAADVAARTAPMQPRTGQPQYDPQLFDPLTVKDPYAGPARPGFRGYADADADIQAGVARERAMLDEVDAMREFDTRVQSDQAFADFIDTPTGIGVRERGAPEAGWRSPQDTPIELAADEAIDARLFRDRVRGGSNFDDYVARETELPARWQAEADAADLDARATPQAGFEAPIPERMLPPPPEPARWEDVSPRAATPIERMLRNLVPERVLKGPGVAEAAEQQARQAADQRSPLQRLFEPLSRDADPTLRAIDERNARLDRLDDARARVATAAEGSPGFSRYLDDEARIAREVENSESAVDLGALAAERRAAREAQPSALQRLFAPVQRPRWETDAAKDSISASMRARIPKRLLDESGEVQAELVPTLAGGVAGGVAGATYGDETDEHIGGAAAGTLAGLAGGNALARFMKGRRPAAELPYHERPLPKPGEPIAPIRGAETPTKKWIIENDRQVFEFEPSNALPRRQEMPKAQADNLGLHNFPEESRDAIAEVIAEFDPQDIARQRGGRQPIAHTEALARRMQLDAETPLAPGKNLSRAGHTAYANAFHATALEARELARKQRTDGLNDRELARFVIVQQANRALGMSYFGLRSEAGGSLNVYRHLKKLMPGEVRLITEMIDRGRLRKDMADLANLYADLPDDPVKAFERLREIEQTQRTTMDKVTSYYTSNILSGVKTQLRNVLGNTSRLIARLPAKASAGALDAFIAKAKGREREVYASEVRHELQGLYAGLGSAWRDGIETFKLGFSPQGLKEGLEDLTSLHVPRVEFKGGLKNPINLPGRGMAAADRFFRQLNASMEMYGETYARARRSAERQGLDGAAFTDSVAASMAEQRMNPSRELKQRVSKAAERAVYQNEPGPAVRALGAFIKHVPAARFAVPFLGTVHQILKQGAIDFGPLGFLRTAARSGELRDQMGARGEALAGTLALFPIAMMAATGGISGAGPTDPRKRDELYESGWRPHSIRVPGGSIANYVAEALGASQSDDGDWWVNYTLLQPIAVQAAIVANGFEAWQERQEQQANKSNPDEIDSIATSTVMRAAQSAFDQSFLSGLGDLIDAINDPNKGQTFFGRLAQGFLPMSGLMRNVAQAVDPVVRQPEGVAEHIAANIPFASQTVDPRLDRWGEDVTRTGFGAMMVPEAQPVNRDPIADELSRLDVNVGRPSDRLRAPAEMGGGPVKMDDATSLEVRRFRGRSTRAMLSMVMGAPGYENLPDFVRAEMLREAVSEASTNASDAARMSLLLQRPELLRLLAEPIEEAAAASYPAR